MEVIAHRGASGHFAENTSAAFSAAVEMGADGIELDVRRSRDLGLIVHHDAHLADGRAIVEWDADQIGPDVLGLAAALEACRGAWVNIEIKNSPDDVDFDPSRSLAAEVLACRRPEGQRWLISSFDPGMIDRVRDLDPTMPTALLVVDGSDEEIQWCVAGGHRALHPWVGSLSAERVAAIQDAGLVCNTWTCNDADRLLDLVHWGVDGVCTDYPDLARRVIDGRGSSPTIR
jgi:glycerophosphoryl diester phosphodiesterase